MLERRDLSLILQQREGRVLVRNVLHVHKLHQSTAVQEEDDYEMDMNLPQAVDQGVWRPSNHPSI